MNILSLLFCCCLVACCLAFCTADAQTCTPIDQCSCKLPDGPIITLWDIDKRYKVDSLTAGFSYLYSPCTGLKEPNSDCDGSLGCQVADDQSKISIANKQAMIDVRKDEASGLYTFSYTGSVDQSTKKKIKFEVLLQCKEGVDAEFTKITCPFDLCVTTLTSRCACPGHCKIPKSGPTASKHGLSTGSTLCIILLVFVIVYIIAGILISKYALHKEGSDIIPHKSFWLDFPSLVKDGCVFTAQKLRRGKGEYQEI